jgi:hypothetical protein
MNRKNDEKIKYYKKKKNMYANDEINSFDEDDDNSEYVLFMAINDQYELSNNKYINHEDSDEEGEVNLEGELICALQELKKPRMKNASLKEQLRESK